MIQRVQCIVCSTQRMRTDVACQTCDSVEYTAVKPGPRDVEAIEVAVRSEAECMDHALQAGAIITRGHPNALRLADACRALALARVGILVR